MSQFIFWFYTLCLTTFGFGYLVLSETALPLVDVCNTETAFFKEKKTYYFKYRATIENENDLKVNTNVDCIVVLNSLGNCHYSLKTTNCRLSNLENVNRQQKSAAFSTQMEKYPVLFSMSDGHIDVIAAHVHENLSLLNVKRGIISAFQNAMHPSFYENHIIRNDVHGNCSYYYVRKDLSTITSTRRLSNCGLIKSNKYSQSPISLYGGLHIEHVYSMIETCEYEFSDVEDDPQLSKIKCVERPHFNDVSSLILSFQPRLKRELSIINTTSWSGERIHKKDYRLTNITFENQKLSTHHSVNLRKNVIELMEKIIDLPNYLVELESSWFFNDLVDLLKHSDSLESISKGIDNCWESPRCNPEKNVSATNNQIQIAHIWRDALFKCYSVACIKALKTFIVSNPPSADVVLGKQILNTIFIRWLIRGNSHPEFIQNIYEICRFTNQSMCYLAMSANIDRYWHSNQNRYSISTNLKAIVETIVEQVRNCEAMSVENSDILVSLKVISNIGEFAEIAEPDVISILQKCATKSLEWEIGLSSVQAFRKMEPSNELFKILLELVQNSNLNEDVRVHAYIILFEKWNEKAVDSIHEFLKNNVEKTPFKIFIYSHIKSVLTTQKSTRTKLAKALRKIVDDDSDEFISTDVYNKHVSKYFERIYYHKSLMTTMDTATFGFFMSEILLYDGTSFLPYSATQHLKLTLFGSEIDVSEIAVHSKGFANILSSILRQFSEGGQKDSKVTANLLFNPAFRSTLFKFIPRNLDKQLVKNLEKIINELADSLYTKPSILFNLKALDYDAAVATFLSFLTFTLSKTGIAAGNSFFRTYMNILSGSVEMPTTLGLPLKFVIDGEIPISIAQKTTHHKLKPKEMKVVGLNKEITFNLGLSMQTRAIVELPEFFQLGSSDEAFASTSGAFTIDASLDLSPDGKKKLRIDFPQNSKHSLTFSKQHVVIEDGQRRELFQNDKQKPAKCSQLYFGVQLCRRNMYEHAAIPNFYNSLVMQIPETHPISFQLQYKSNFDATAKDQTLSLSAFNNKANKFQHILKFLHRRFITKPVHEIKIDSEIFKDLRLSASLNYLSPSEYNINLNGGCSEINYQYSLKNYMSTVGDDLTNFATKCLTKAKVNKMGLLGHHQTHNFFVSTPAGNLTTVFAKQIFPLNYFYDLSFQFKCVNEEMAKMISHTLPSSIAWEDSTTMKLEAHYDESYSLENLTTRIIEQTSQGILRFPKYVIELNSKALKKEHSSNDYSYTLEFQDLSEKNPQWSYKLRFLENGDEINKEQIIVKFSVPTITYVALLSKICSKERDQLSMKLQRRLYSGLSHEHQINSANYYITDELQESYNEIAFNIDLNKTETNIKTFDALADVYYKNLPGLDNGMDGSIQLNVTIQDHGPLLYNVVYNLNSTFDRAVTGKFELHGMHGFQQQFQLLGPLNQNLATYNSFLRRTIAGLSYGDNLVSEVYSFASNLTCDFSKEYKDIDYNITARSPIWSLLNVDLKQHVSEGSETMTMTHDIVDISVEASWLNGYHKSFAFNSKMDELLPNMRWQLDCNSTYYCAAQLVFALPTFTSLYVIYELSPGGTEMTFTLCWNDICQDEASDVNFVGKTSLSLVNSDNVLKSVRVINRHYNVMKQKLLETLSVWVLQTARTIGDSTHSAHRIYEYFTGIPLEELVSRFVSLTASTYSIAAQDVSHLIEPMIPVAVSAVKLSLNVFTRLSSSDFGYAIESYSPRRVQRFFIFVMALLDFRRDEGIRSVSYVEESWVQQIYHPFVMKSFKRGPDNFNPEYFRYLLDFTDNHAIYDAFYDEKYSRVAVVIGSTSVKPFQGDLIPIEFPNCSYLLSYDMEEQSFVIYKTGYWLHFIFSETHLELSYENGQLNVNSSYREMPFQSSNGEFSVIRKEDFVIVSTQYHLKVVCNINSRYCILYTDHWKYGKLYGLLGNNTDDVHIQVTTDVKKYTSMFQLTDSSHCKEEHVKRAEAQSHHKCTIFVDEYPFIGRTFLCSDVAKHNSHFRNCRNHYVGNNFGEMDSAVGSYFAACGAMGVKIDVDTKNDYKCDEHKFGSEWKTKVSGKKVEIVFLVDQNLDAKKWPKYSKELTNLALHSVRDFSADDFSEVNFGLFGLKGKGDLIEPTVYTSDGQFWAPVESFAVKALSNLFSTLDFNYPESGSQELLQAIRFAIKFTPFTPGVVHIIVLIVPKDPFDDIDVDIIQETLQSLDSEQIILHTIADVPNPNVNRSSHDSKVNIMGHYSRLSLATNGSSWSFGELESMSKYGKHLSISKSMVSGAQHLRNRCLSCTCERPKFFKPYAQCIFAENC